MEQRTLPGADFLWPVLPHVQHMRAVPTPAMPPRPKWRCVCGQPMHVVVRRMSTLQPEGAPNGQAVNADRPDKTAAVPVHTMQ